MNKYKVVTHMSADPYIFDKTIINYMISIPNNDYAFLDISFNSKKDAELICDELNLLYDKIYKLYKKLNECDDELNINCHYCSHYQQSLYSKDCMVRDDIGVHGTCIDDYDLHKLAMRCAYYDG